MGFKDKIVEVISSRKQKLMSFDEIAKYMGLVSGFDKQALAGALNDLVREDKLVFTKRNKYTLPDNTGATKCKIMAHPNGYISKRFCER